MRRVRIGEEAPPEEANLKWRAGRGHSTVTHIRARGARLTSGRERPAIVIPPAGVGEVLDLGFSLARRNFKFVVLLYAWAAVPAGVFATVASIPFYLTSSAGDSLTVIAGGLFALGSLVSTVGHALATLAVTIACARLIAPMGDPADLEVSRLYRDALGRVGWLFLWVLVLVIPALLLFLLFPLGVYVGIRWSQSWIALVVDREGPLSSLARSWSLTRGAWWHTFIVLLAISIIIGLLTYAMLAALMIVAGPLMFVTGSPAIWGIINTLGSSLASIIFAPFSSAMAVVLYFELRARAEGFDLEQRALQVALSE